MGKLKRLIHKAPDAQNLDEINSIPIDRNRIIAWNKEDKSDSNFVIIDKKNSKLTVYSPDGKEIKSAEVGTGQMVGDNYNDAFAKKSIKRTAAGEYSVDYKATGDDIYAKHYGSNLLKLKSAERKEDIAMHQIPDTHPERIAKFNNKSLKDNRMSFGCVNLQKKDIEELKDFIPKGAKVYILPEEKGNTLKLENQSDGETRFVQTKYNLKEAPPPVTMPQLDESIN